MDSLLACTAAEQVTVSMSVLLCQANEIKWKNKYLGYDFDALPRTIPSHPQPRSVGWAKSQSVSSPRGHIRAFAPVFAGYGRRAILPTRNGNGAFAPPYIYARAAAGPYAAWTSSASFLRA